MVSSRRPVWVRNLRVLSVGVFFAGMGFSEVTPLPFFIHCHPRSLQPPAAELLFRASLLGDVLRFRLYLPRLGTVSGPLRAQTDVPTRRPGNGNRFGGDGVSHQRLATDWATDGPGGLCRFHFQLQRPDRHRDPQGKEWWRHRGNSHWGDRFCFHQPVPLFRQRLLAPTQGEPLTLRPRSVGQAAKEGGLFLFATHRG